MSIDMQNLTKLLEDHFHKSGWDITRPKDGWENGSYIATLNNEKYFIKFGINPKVMRRLSDLEVTPQVLTIGERESETYMIQEFNRGAYVPTEWFKDNLKQLADFIDKYQDDKELSQILKETAPKDKLSISGELEALESQLNAIDSDGKLQQVREGIGELKSRYKKLTTKLVPVHDDPNTKNIFLTNNKLQMVDWNNIRLSDQLSDIGSILWWYIPEPKWEEFFDYYKLKTNDEVTERIYLAAAKMTMGFIIWAIEHNKDYTVGLNDFSAAINKKPNPRAWFNR
jgi:thiamine kinase-like enzyme